MAKRHFLQLAHNYVLGAPIGGWYASEKLDGMRAFWDGGITRGIPCSSVAFANTDRKAHRIKAPMSTGLWSRYGNPIYAPEAFLEALPPFCLDGELYAGRGNFQKLMSTVKDFVPGHGWSDVKYMVFDMPPPHVVWGDGEISETNFKKKFVHLASKHKFPEYPFKGAPQFMEVIKGMNLNRILPVNSVLQVHLQVQLDPMTRDAVEQMNKMLDAVVEAGGEGLILRSPTSTWIPSRVRTCLKVKSQLDAEGVVTGYTSGRQTDLGSKLLGLMGALVLNYNGHRLELSGFSDTERALVGSVGGDSATAFAVANPGVELPDSVTNPLFPRGAKVSFRFRELTDSGIPKEARYWRNRPDE